MKIRLAAFARPRLTGRVTLSVLVAASLSSGGCDDTRLDSYSCFQQSCPEGFACSPAHRCVPASDGGGAEGVADAPAFFVDASLGLDSGAIDLARDVPLSSNELDAGVDGAALDVTVDVARLDVAGSCGDDGDCPSPTPFCLDARCVACKTGEQCGGSLPVCSADHGCVSCTAVDGGCPSTAPTCEVDSGRCVQCLVDADCAQDPAQSFCVAGACVGCGGASAGACAARDASKPACLATGLCAMCASSADCALAAKPICDTSHFLCVACATDAQCAAKGVGPGVCPYHLDGHCATDGETIYVDSSAAACSDSAAGAGSAQTPFCHAKPGVAAAQAQGKLAVVLAGALSGGVTGLALGTPLTIVGKSAVLTPTSYSDGLGITSGELYLRGVTVMGSASDQTGIGINASADSGKSVTLHVDGCSVVNNPSGGILLSGAGFEIKNTTVMGNGPNSAAWGGIFVQSPPAGGPTTFDHVTVSNNNQAGISCGASIAATDSGTGVLAQNNSGVNVADVCGITTCGVASADCGAP